MIFHTHKISRIIAEKAKINRAAHNFMKAK